MEGQVWVILFSGFTQQFNNPIGTIRIWRHLTQYREPSFNLGLYKWYTDVKELAGKINMLNCFAPVRPKIVVAGYSYGGQTAVRFAEELSKHTYDVESMILCDAVRRWTSKIPTPSSLFNFWEIQVPSNVKRLSWAHQRVTRPYGHKVISSVGTQLVEKKELTLPHVQCDRAPWYLETVDREVKRILQ